MPEPKETKEQTSSVTLNIKDLQALISTAVAEAVKQANVSTAEAIIESKKPYIDPKQKENEAAMRRSMKEVEERRHKEQEMDQSLCPHKQGSNALSDFQGPLSSFIYHQLDTGELIGICTNCTKVIRSTNPQDAPFFQMKSGNRASRAGQRIFTNPLEVQRRGR